MFNIISIPLRLFIYSSSWVAAMDALATGSLLTAYAAALDAGPIIIGSILAMPYMGNGCQAIGAYFVFKGYSAKHITIAFSLASRFFYIGCASLVLFPKLPHRPLWLLFFIASCYLTGGISAGGYYPWLKASLPPEHTATFVRYKYTFSKIFYLGGFILAFIWFKRYTALSLTVPSSAYLGLFGGAFVCGLLATFLFVPIPSVDIPHSSVSFNQSLLHIAAQPKFRSVMYIATLSCFASYYFFTLLPLFALKQWHISVLNLTLLTLFSQVAAIGFIPLWKKMNQLYHPLFSAQCGLWGCMFLMGWLIFYTTRVPAVLAGVVLFILSGILQIGINLAMDTLILWKAPRDHEEPYFTWMAIVKTIAATGIIVAGVCLHYFQQILNPQHAWQSFFVIGISCCLVSLCVIYKTFSTHISSSSLI